MKPLKPQILYLITYKGVPEEDTPPEPLERQWAAICHPLPPTPRNVLTHKAEGWATRPVLCIPCDLVSVEALQKKVAKALCAHLKDRIGDNSPLEDGDIAEVDLQTLLALSRVHPVLGAKPHARKTR